MNIYSNCTSYVLFYVVTMFIFYSSIFWVPFLPDKGECSAREINFFLNTERLVFRMSFTKHDTPYWPLFVQR